MLACSDLTIAHGDITAVAGVNRTVTRRVYAAARKERAAAGYPLTMGRRR